MNAYFMHDRIEERAWQDHYLQIAREEEEAELADLYDRQIKFHHLHALLSNTQADKAALTATFDDVRQAALARLRLLRLRAYHSLQFGKLFLVELRVQQRLLILLKL